MAKKIILDPIWECETIPDMKFETEEDADKFDSVLRNYISNKEAISEFEKAENGFPSWAALWRQISIGEFHFKLEGKYSDELIAACETCFEVGEIAIIAIAILLLWLIYLITCIQMWLNYFLKKGIDKKEQINNYLKYGKF
jgi:hypothetical protein